MLRNTKWKVDKPKVKVVFRLQFHATNIPQSGWEKLFICFIPIESGRIIAKTSKANVRNGACKWADPIYETTRLLVDSRNKRYEDKFYNLIVGMGTSHASILGEATINLADYADATNPFVVALPLHGSDHGTILHVTVQLLTGKTGFREFEQQFDRRLQSSSNLNREVEPNVAASSSYELQISDDLGNKVAETSIHEEFSDSSVEYNGSSNGPDSSVIHEPMDLTETDAPQNQIPPTKQPNSPDHQRSMGHQQSTDHDDLAIAREENLRLRGILETAKSFISDLKLEINALRNHANEMSTETHKIADDLTAEISSGLKLEREIMILRSECSKFKDELEQLKEIKIRSNFVDRKTRDQDRGESQSFEILSQLDEAKAENVNLVKKMNEMECYYESLVQELEENRERSLGEFRKVLYEHSNCVQTISICKTETESIRRCMKDQILKFDKERYDLSCVVEELEKNREWILGEFQFLKNEHSTCADVILNGKNEIELLRREMNDQTLKFAKEKHDLGRVNDQIVKFSEEIEDLIRINEGLKKRNSELEENRGRILGEFESLKNEHLICGDTILTFKSQTLKFAKEKGDLNRVNEELKKTVSELEKKRERILEEFESLKNESLTCGETILTFKSQTLKFAKEKDDLNRVNEELKKTVSELEKNRERILEDFEILKNEHSTCVDTILTYKTETESIRNDMNDQTLKFAKEKDDLNHVNEELKKRVSILESSLERARLNYSIAVTQLQKDVDVLSSQVSSMFETNQNLIKQTFSQNNVLDFPQDNKGETVICEKLELDIIRVALKAKLNEHISRTEKNEPSESLRIAFMKEKCETTVQELKQQLFVSKRHGDDILIKLQDALDEIESRKKSDVFYSKKIEELSVKIAGLESELQSKRAELDCAHLNLECCKEEKEKIVASMKRCEREDKSVLSIMSSGSNFQDLRREIVQLHKVNEELGSIFPNFKDFHRDGNALERVLALEIELAEALTKKKKSSITFQSSFLKQLGDEEAIFKSFKDINEVIKDTLEVKGKYVNLENELNEMHDRYSQLSLKFAEVEGERQKLIMTVKNVRSPRNRSSSETLGDILL